MIGERLYDLRKDAGLSQEQLAAIINVNKHSISSYERERSEPSDDIKIQLAQYFGVSVDYLIGLSDDPAPKQRGACLTMRLPKSFPTAALPELKSFVEYLMFKYRKEK